MNLLTLSVLIGLASFRATYLWRYDMLTEKLRDYIWSWLPPADGFVPKMRTKRPSVPVIMSNGETWFQTLKPSFVGDLSSCHWCVSAYITAALTVLAKFSVERVAWPSLVVVWLASWGVACLLLDHARR